ncbi:MAG: dTDP-4-dehydrorhamnose 3,5-epimerase [Gammaproteobacteria bacterium]
MKVRPTKLDGVYVVENQAFRDQRGAFARIYCEETLAEIVGSRRIVQINHSLSVRAGTIRGMHYQQPPYAEMKLIHCLKGRVWDVAVDLRAASPTFLQWHGVELSAVEGTILVIPEGCAHGFQVLEAGSELLYLHTAAYRPDAEVGVAYNDPAVGIVWPLAPTALSDKDRNHPLLDEAFSGVRL